MAWFYLILAGLLETAWAAGLKNIAEKFNFSMLLITTGLIAGSLYLLYVSMRSLPLGVAYPIWTGIGSIGSIVVGVLIFKQEIGLYTIVGVTLLITGMFLIGMESQ
jgi:quaternary ammonium compound-resistance protein SugE